MNITGISYGPPVYRTIAASTSANTAPLTATETIGGSRVVLSGQTPLENGSVEARPQGFGTAGVAAYKSIAS